MKILIKKELLIKGIGIVEKIIGRNLTLPILNNILIKAENKSIKIISTDLEVGISVQIPTKIEKEGTIAIQPRTLMGFLNSLPDENLNLTTKNNTLFIEQGEFKTSLKGEDDKEFPTLPQIKEELSFNIDSQILINSFKQIINSVSISDLKPELTGILLSIEKDQIKLATTDSFRLSEKKIAQKTNIKGNKRFIIPSKTVGEIIKTFQDYKGELILYLDKNQIALKNKDNQKIKIILISKLIEGDYPEYSQIIPKEIKIRTIISKNQFLQQIKTASLFSNRINDIKLTIKKDKIILNSENYDIGSFQSSITASTDGGEQDINFNHQYLIDGINNIEGDEIVLKLNKKDTPAILESTKKKDYFYILMPIRGN